MSFMGIRSGLKGQERDGSNTTPTKATDCREGLGASSTTPFSPEHGDGRVRAPMRGSPEHLLLHEAQVLTKGRDGSRHRKRLARDEGLEPRKCEEKPRGRDEPSLTGKSETGSKSQP